MSRVAEELALDASVCINLVATDRFASIAAALGASIVVVEPVAREVMRHPFDGAAPSSPLARYADDGTIRIASLTGGTADTWLSLVGASPPDDLDDGEAATIAFAHHASVTAVIDEKKGIRVCSSRFPGLKQLSTLDLLRFPAVQRALGKDVLAEAVWSALRYARMRVPPSHESWVRELVGAERLRECHSVRLAARTPMVMRSRNTRRSRGGE